MTSINITSCYDYNYKNNINNIKSYNFIDIISILLNKNKWVKNNKTLDNVKLNRLNVTRINNRINNKTNNRQLKNNNNQ